MYVDSLFLLKSVTLDSQIVSRSAGQKTNHEMMNGNVVAYEFSQRSDRYINFFGNFNRSSADRDASHARNHPSTKKPM
jgi:hypothetical protein